MPAHRRNLKAADGLLAQFALALRRLRDQAPEGRAASVDQIVKQSGRRVSRAAIFSALSGRTLPSRETLAVIVSAWSPGGAEDIAEWNLLRSKYEQGLSASYTRTIETPATTGTNRLRNTSDLGEVGAVIRQLRVEAGLSLGQMARRINYSKGQLSKVENGYARPTLGMLNLLDMTLETGGTLQRMVRPQTSY